MRSKHIAALIAFFLTFGFSAAFASLFIDRSAADIQAFLLQDIRYGEERNYSRYHHSAEKQPSSCWRSSKRVDPVAEYVNRSSSMDDSEFPQDFQSAWREHMQAWRDYSNFLQAKKSGNLDYEDFHLSEDRYISEINFTWYKVLSVADKYGAKVPAYAR